MGKTSLFASLMCVLISTYALGIGGDMGGTDPNGSPEKPYLIEDLTDFDTFADPNNAATYWAAGVHTKLTTDIDLSGRTYTTAVIAPDIPDTSSDFDGIAFEGIVEGNYFTIFNLKIDTNLTGRRYYGLFGVIYNGQVLNLGIHNASISIGDNSGHVGGLAGSNDSGIINNCYSTGEIVGGGWDFGGLLGSNKGGGLISKSHSSVSVACLDNYSDFLGGLIGYNDDGTINNCFSTGVITGGNRDLGGLVGRNYGDIYESHTECIINGGSYSYEVGGLIGINIGGKITNCESALKTRF